MSLSVVEEGVCALTETDVSAERHTATMKKMRIVAP
jgi:hypothetical protein